MHLATCLINLLKNTCNFWKNNNVICSKREQDLLHKDLIMVLSRSLQLTWIRLRWLSTTFSSNQVLRNNPLEAILSGRVEPLVVLSIRLLLTEIGTSRLPLFRNGNLAPTCNHRQVMLSNQPLRLWEICLQGLRRHHLEIPLPVSQTKSLKQLVTSKYLNKKR